MANCSAGKLTCDGGGREGGLEGLEGGVSERESRKERATLARRKEGARAFSL